MMEVAGLVLAILPVVVNGISGFARAAGTFQTLRRPTQEYRRYGLFLKQQLALYQDVLTELLGGIVDDDDDLKAMIQDPNHDLWKSGHYDEPLQKRLGTSYNIFLETTGEVEDKLWTLVEKLNLQENVYGAQGKDESFYKKELGRFKVAFNKDAYTDLYNDIDALNKFLSTTTQASIRIEDRRRKSKPMGNKHAARIRRLREHARNIHKSVVASDMCWGCACKHKVMLRVRSSHEEAELFPKRWLLDVNEPQLQKWHLLELYPEDSSHDGSKPAALTTASVNTCGQVKKRVKWQIPDPNLAAYSVAQVKMGAMSLTQVRIHDLCATLMSQVNPSANDLGFLESMGEPWRCRVNYKKATTHQDVETLSQLLARNAAQSSPFQAVFSKRERLAAAATLAYSVLFLDGSWLQPVWNSRDIVLLKDVDKVRDKYGTTHPVHELAFSWVVCDTLNSKLTDADREVKAQKLSMFRKSTVLYALSMALIELSLGEPMELLKTDQERSMEFVWGDIAAATRLLPHVHDTSGFEYKEVVRRCLDCPFDVQSPTMDNDAFLSIYFDQIVRPLMADYEQFIGYK